MPCMEPPQAQWDDEDKEDDERMNMDEEQPPVVSLTEEEEKICFRKLTQTDHPPFLRPGYIGLTMANPI